MDPGIPSLGISDYIYLDLLTIWQGTSSTFLKLYLVDHEYQNCQTVLYKE